MESATAPASSEQPTTSAPSSAAPSEAPASTPEPAPATPAAPDPAAERLSRGFAKLTRTEQELRRREAALKEKEAKYQRYEALDPKADPLAYLEAGGVTYKELTDFILKNNKAPTTPRDRELEGKLAKLERELQEREARAAQAEQERAIENVKAEIDHFLRQNADTYELTALHGAGPVVFKVIEDTYQESGRILDYEEAAKLVETHFENEAKKLLSAKKFRQPPAPAGSVTPAPERTTETVSRSEPSTISNQHAATITTRRERELSKEESIEEAAKLLRWGE